VLALGSPRSTAHTVRTACCSLDFFPVSTHFSTPSLLVGIRRSLSCPPPAPLRIHLSSSCARAFRSPCLLISTTSCLPQAAHQRSFGSAPCRWCPHFNARTPVVSAGFRGIDLNATDDHGTSSPLGYLEVMFGPMFPILEGLAITDVTPVAALRQYMTKVASKPDDTRSRHPNLVQCIFPVEFTSPWVLRYRVVRNPSPLLLLRRWVFA
jgi:hypothetical protein